MINMTTLRELTAESGFMPATTDGPGIDRHRQLNKNAPTGWPVVAARISDSRTISSASP